METLLLFLITAATSFVGSLQAGLVNTAVLARTIQAGTREGRKVALGGAVPELLYAGLAFGASTLISDLLHDHAPVMRLAGGCFLLGLGAYFLFRFDPLLRADASRSGHGGFLMGLVLGLLNPQLILFWSGVLLAMTASGRGPKGPMDLLAFATGAFIGALALLLLLVAFADRLQQRSPPFALRRVFRSVGLLLMVTGLFVLLR
jgi:threonine/homoserine/homoserine lactone efflux protein